MKKYIETARFYFKAQLAFRFNVVMGILLAVGRIIFAYVLWGAVFSDRGTYGGFTFDTMLAYYIINGFLTQFELSDGVSGEVSARIRGGTFSKYMVLPADVEGYFFAQSLGASAFYMIIAAVTSGVWILLFGVKITFVGGSVIALAALMAFMGMIVMIQINYFLGLLTFKFMNISIFLMIKSNLFALLNGTLIPLALMPGWFGNIFRYTPLYYVSYLPSMMAIGRLVEQAAFGFATLGVWMIALFIINRRAYSVLRVRFDGVGI